MERFLRVNFIKGVRHFKYGVLLLILLQSCSDNDSIFVGPTVSVNVPAGKPVLIEPVRQDFFGALNIFAAYDFLMTLNRPEMEFLISVYDKNDFSHLGSFIRKGKGPGEYIDVNFEKIITDGGVKVWFSTGSSFKFILLDIDKSLNAGQTQIEAEIDLRKLSADNNIFRFIDEDSVFGESYEEEGIKHSYNSIPDNVVLARYTPYRVKGLQWHAYAGFKIIKPDGTKWAQSTAFFEQIHISSPDGEETVTILTGKSPAQDDVSKKQQWENREYYKSMACTDEYLFAVYQPDQPDCTEIRVFDWDGRFIINFTAPVTFRFITLDPKKQVIYAMKSEEEVYKIKIREYLEF